MSFISTFLQSHKLGEAMLPMLVVDEPCTKETRRPKVSCEDLETDVLIL